jgi:surface antigen
MRLGAAFAAMLWLAACSADTGRKEAGGTTFGGAGGLAGNSNGGAVGSRSTGKSIGPGLGALLNDHAGAALDDEDKRRASVAELQALETGPSGAPVAWRNPETGRYGNVVPGPVYQENGVACREYTHTVYVEGNAQTEHGTACRKSDGTWAIVG